MKQRNPRFGCPRIAQQISKAFGIEINKDTVRRVLAKHYRPGSNDGGPSWRTFLGHLTDSLRSTNWFRCKLPALRNHRVLGMLNSFIRQIMGYDIHYGSVDEIACCPLLENAASMMEAQKPLNSDHDPPLLYHRWERMLLGGDATNTVAILPLSLPCAEWRMETVSGNNIDYLPFYNAVDLEGKFKEFTNFCILLRLHSPINEDTSAKIDKCSVLDRAKIDHFAWKRHCYELFQAPIAA